MTKEVACVIELKSSVFVSESGSSYTALAILGLSMETGLDPDSGDQPASASPVLRLQMSASMHQQSRSLSHQEVLSSFYPSYCFVFCLQGLVI